MSEQSLLPGNTCDLERQAALALAQIQRVPIPLRQLWNPNTCPTPLLRICAWQIFLRNWAAIVVASSTAILRAAAQIGVAIALLVAGVADARIDDAVHGDIRFGRGGGSVHARSGTILISSA